MALVETRSDNAIFPMSNGDAMKAIALGIALSTTAICSAAHAESHKIKSLTIDVRGGGDYQAIVTRVDDTRMNVMTTRCNFKLLSKQDQAKTVLTVTGASGIALFDGKATIDDGDPSSMPRGSWSTLKVEYDTEESGLGNTWQNFFFAPVVTIDGRESNVLQRFLDRAAKGAVSVCAE
jgi:hypothetical protein